MGLASVLNIVLFFSFWINFFFSFILLWSSLFNFYLRSESLKQCLVFCLFVLFFCFLLFLFLLLLFVWFVLFFFLSHVFFLLWLLHFVWSALLYKSRIHFPNKLIVLSENKTKFNKKEKTWEKNAGKNFSIQQNNSKERENNMNDSWNGIR